MFVFMMLVVPLVVKTLLNDSKRSKKSSGFFFYFYFFVPSWALASLFVHSCRLLAAPPRVIGHSPVFRTNLAQLSYRKLPVNDLAGWASKTAGVLESVKEGI